MGRRRKNFTIRLSAQKIFNLLAKSSMSIKDLAKRTGEIGQGKAINYNYLNDLLAKDPRSVPTTVIVGKIARALDVEPWQIADGLEPTPEMPMVVHEDQAPYGERSRQVFNLAMIKARRATLSDDELKQLGGVIGQVVDILTIENPKERARSAPLLVGAINSYHTVIFQEGGRADKEKSFPLEEGKEEGS